MGAAALTILLGYALIAGLAMRGGEPAAEALPLFDIGRDPPPPPAEPRTPAELPSARPEGAAAPPNLRSEATQVVAPPPVVPVPLDSKIVTAPLAGLGSDSSTGSADIAGPGTGNGGLGDGRGSGGSGDGDGAGGDEIGPEWLGGRIRDSDYPDALAEAGVGGTVGVRYTVWTDGRVRDCEVTDSSGNAQLDAATCRLIRERFRFRPSRDGKGRPVPATIVENHSWEFRRDPAPAQPVERQRKRFRPFG